MKRNIYIAMMAFLVIFATSCEKIAENKETLNNNKAFYNVKWVPVMQKSGMINEDGLKGDLYINENNMQDLMYLIDVNENLDNPLINNPNDPCYTNEPLCEQATGTFREVYRMENGVKILDKICCDGARYNCWWSSTILNGKKMPLIDRCENYIENK